LLFIELILEIGYFSYIESLSMLIIDRG